MPPAITRANIDGVTRLGPQPYTAEPLTARPLIPCSPMPTVNSIAGGTKTLQRPTARKKQTPQLRASRPSETVERGTRPVGWVMPKQDRGSHRTVDVSTDTASTPKKASFREGCRLGVSPPL